MGIKIKRIMIMLIPFVIMDSTIVNGLSTWKETSNNFRLGLNNHTIINDENLTIDNQTPICNSWIQLSDGIPNGLSESGMVYDSPNNIIILFGGQSSMNCIDDTWKYNVSTSRWMRMTCDIRPSPRKGHAMVYDPDDKITVLFGGSNWQDHTIYYNDTWMYDSNLNKWTNMNSTNPPSGREGSAMVYDSNNKLFFLFGGFDGQNNNNTWTYNLKSNIWKKINPNYNPLARSWHAMVYDSKNNKIILFGGLGGTNNSAMDDTWVFDYNMNWWSEKNPNTAPSPRIGHSMVYNYVDSTIIAFGGSSDGISFNNETWIFNSNDDLWINKSQDIAPSQRYFHSMIYCNYLNSAVVFGGYNYLHGQNDLWTYDISDNSWIKKENQIPTGGCGSSMAYDLITNEAILFGGTNWYNPSSFCDTYAFNFTSKIWINLNPSNPPTGHYDHSMVFDSQDNLFIMFGGLAYCPNNLEQMTNDTWIYNRLLNKWILRNPDISPPARARHAMVYDNRDNIVILFGGDGTNIYSESLNDTWTYIIKDNKWNNMNPVISPPPRAYHSMVYDDKLGEVIIFGGDYKAMNETWSYNVTTNTWINKKPSNTPSARYMHTMVYNAVSGNIILHGGVWNAKLLNDTWAYDPLNNFWTNLDPINPLARRSQSMVCDDKEGRIILFGGATDIIYGDTWEYYLHYFGEYISNKYNTGGKPYFGSFHWEYIIPNHTSIRFQLRTSDTQMDLDSKLFVGPDGTDRSFYDKNGQIINPIHNTNRWIQYKALFITWNLSIDPQLKSVMINYNLIHSVTIQNPKTDDVWDGIQNISWLVDEKDNDSLNFDIYIENNTASILIINNLTNNIRYWIWDTTIIPNGTYRIFIRARDDNPLIPLIINATSGFFTIYHSIPSPPICKIIFPNPGTYVNGIVRIRGIAINGSNQLQIIQIRIDNSDWSNATGLENWIFLVDMNNYKEGKHEIYARAFDGKEYSTIASTEIIVDHSNSKPTVDKLSLIQILIFIIIISIIFITIMIINKKKR